MKKISFFAVILSAILFISSCKKDEGKLPNIAFKTVAGYISANGSVPHDSVFVVGITASKAESNDVLKTFTATKSFNGGADSTIYTETLSGSLGDNYSKDLPIMSGHTAGTEKYTFTVVNKDGLKNSVSVSLTVQ